MIVELHMLQNFAPSNLNRDDTGSPKECEFGGYRRARVSSQCLKRAIRTLFRDEGLMSSNQLGTRSKRVVSEVADRLAARGRDKGEAIPKVWRALQSLELKEDKKNPGQTEYLLFLAESEIERLVHACDSAWDALQAQEDVASDNAESATGRTGGRGKKATKAGSLPKEVISAVAGALNGGKAVDLALFGRMIANAPDHNVDAATQVAHAISTNRVSIEFDFFTAVDDLQPEDNSGAGMLGTVEFNSACYYRYANVDLDQLTKNLCGDRDLALKAVEAFLRASVLAVPSGKQNSMAAQNPPSLVMTVARQRGLWSLANAFAKPVFPGDREGLVERSTAALDQYWNVLKRMYGDGTISAVAVCAEFPAKLSHLKDAEVSSASDLYARTLAALGQASG